MGKLGTLKSVIDYLNRQVIMRKFFVLLFLLSIWTGLLLSGLLSKDRQIYSPQQLATEQNFSNGTGEINLVSQTYSEKNGILVLQFETEDMTSSVNKGIDSDKLKWNLYGKEKETGQKTSMQVIPVIDNKISVVVKNVQKDFEVLAVEVTNETVRTDDINVSLSETESSTSESKTNDSIDEKSVTFFITPRSGKIKNKKIKNVSREEFAIQQLDAEMQNQSNSIQKLETSIDKLTESIKNDESTLSDLQLKAQYLSGEDLETNDKDITSIKNDIESKTTTIDNAKQSIDTLKKRSNMLLKKEKDIKNGNFIFTESIETVELK